MNRDSCFLGQMVVSGCGGVEENEICLLTLLQTVAYGGGSLMVWGGIFLISKTDLIFIRGNLTAERYVEEFVQNHILPFAHEIGPDFVLMQAGARAHTSKGHHKLPRRLGNSGHGLAPTQSRPEFY